MAMSAATAVSSAKRLALIVEDDSACACLAPLTSRGCDVLCIRMGDLPCSVLARQCVEAGFQFVSLADDMLAGVVLEKFSPEVVFFATFGHKDITLSVPSSSKAFAVRAGCSMEGAPWPEFAPLFLGQERSFVWLSAGPADAEVVGSTSVAVSPSDTALSLRRKHAEAASGLILSLLDGTADQKMHDSSSCCQKVDSLAPARICISWEEGTIARYIRAHFMPPLGAAIVSNPEVEQDEYFIENFEQYLEFCNKVLTPKNLVGKDGAHGECRMYAADTHWYSNVGGSIIKMGDTTGHMPVKTTAKKRTMVIPGAAISGAKKLRMNEPLIGMNAERYCSNALASGWIGVEGPYVKQFEKELARICGCRSACAVQSGTAALYGAMKALGVSDPSHHVLVPAFTCAAAADAVVHAGGLPVPMDCELDSYGMSMDAVRAALEADRNIVGVCLAPCYGVPARDTMEILAMCKDRGLWLCEDACETYGAAYSLESDGRESKVPVGSQATLCVLSVRSEKMIGVGEGGAIVGNDTALVAKAKWWCSRAPCRGGGLWRVYEHDAVGQNFRLPEMLAAVGCAAAEMLPLMIERKRAIHEWYMSKFAADPDLQGVKLQKCAGGDEPVWWINAALLPDGYSGEEVGMLLMKDYPDIEIRPGFFPLNKMDIFKSGFNMPCPNTELLYDRLVCLPSSNQLLEPDVDRICKALANSLRQVKKQ